MRGSPTPTGPAQDTASADIEANLVALGRSLRAGNRSEVTVESDSIGVSQSEAFLARQGMPGDVANIRREPVEALIEEWLAKHRPATAANHYRSLQQFSRWLVEEGEIPASPMARGGCPDPLPSGYAHP